jgi:hypothetical protein
MSLFSKKKLIVAGCSYTDNYAMKIHIQQFPIWAELLADKLDMELVNLGNCGDGNEAIWSKVTDEIVNTKNIGLVVVGWSEVDRVSFFAEVFNRRNSRYQHQWESFKPGRKIDDVESKEKNQEVFKENKAFLISEIFAKYHLLDLRAGSQKTFRYIYNLQTLCESLKVPYLQFQTCYPSAEEMERFGKELINSPYLSLIKDTTFLGWPISEHIGGWCWDYLMDQKDPSRNKMRITKKDTHPNEMGHEYIMEILLDGYKKNYS